ncbi:MAG: NADH-quinone oxidoreductase subunit NuoE [Nitrospira sp. LK70]|nr:NADH-quinone oxidoreductase subunit NuoE [Nitrospira sp. LK70]
MLTDIERHELEAAVKHYPDKRAGAIDALLIVQRRRGWISDDSVLDIAQFLGMTGEDVDSIATFYNLIFRKPVGRHVAFVCDSISCWIMGYEQVCARIKERYEIEPGQTTRDGRLTFLPIACLGHCERAPAMMIDQDVYGCVTPDKVESIVEKYR